MAEKHGKVRNDGVFGTGLTSLGAPTSHTGRSESKSWLSSDFSCLLIRTLGGSRWWAKYFSPCHTHLGDPDCALGAWHWPGPVPVVTGICGVNYYMKGSLFFWVSGIFSNSEILALKHEMILKIRNRSWVLAMKKSLRNVSESRAEKTVHLWYARQCSAKHRFQSILQCRKIPEIPFPGIWS